MQGLLFSPQRRANAIATAEYKYTAQCSTECIHCLVAMARTIVLMLLLLSWPPMP